MSLRKFTLTIIGIAYIGIGTLGLVSTPLPFFSDSSGYNAFLLIMGILSLGAADLGSDFSRGFDFLFSIVLIILVATGSVAFLRYGAESLGNLLMNGTAAVALLYLGLNLNHRLKQLQK